ncbi:hypothetical protein NADFUDRAFT_46025 [Nadsonia fulvescens var. elongata DSM 6958]|uniref:Uncharacterized protein n=1 Tax=Nadsonia fulvescens var. elongata DSM 6958 TaxID=857566 RepID=A0A1E3PMQ4_9ASCO|nr:hypothetical protein NADFUDRAFT_46025 [Nadsonia fulvescens var. elongata DSM 6958]
MNRAAESSTIAAAAAPKISDNPSITNGDNPPSNAHNTLNIKSTPNANTNNISSDYVLNNTGQATFTQSPKIQQLVTAMLTKYTSTLGSGLSLDTSAILSTQLFYKQTQLIYTNQNQQVAGQPQSPVAAELTNNLLRSASSLIDYHLNLASSVTDGSSARQNPESASPSLLRLRFGQHELFVIPDNPYTLVVVIDKSLLSAPL